MFKNPLKYQQGGSAQNAMQKLVAFLVQNTGLDENTISQKLQAILSDETAKAQLTTVLENMQNGNDQEATAKLISMFTQDQTEMKRRGGKIQSFICKHAKGGNIDCGCPKEKLAGMERGRQITKAQGGSNGIYGPTTTDGTGTYRDFYYPEGGYAGRVDLKTGKAYHAGTGEEMLQPGRYNRRGYPIPEGGSTNGTYYEVNPYGRIIVNIPEGGQQVLHGTDSSAVANLVKQWNMAKVGPAAVSRKNGGEIKKKDNTEEPSNGTIKQGKSRSRIAQAVDNNPKARHFVEGTKKFVKSPMVKWPLAGALAYGGYRLGLTPTVQSMGDELAPHMAPYLFPFLSQMRPKFILDTMNPMKEPTKVEKPGDVFWVANDKNGGKVEKAQGGEARLGHRFGGMYAGHNNDELNITTETISMPEGSTTLITSPSPVPERRDSLFIRMPENGNTTWAERRYSDFNSYTDNKYIPVGKRGDFETNRSFWNYYKSKLKSK